MSEGGSSVEGIEVVPIHPEPKGEILSNKETARKPHCLFLSGAMVTNAGIAGIKRGLEVEYGVGKVDAFNSILNLEDPQNLKRFDQMAEVIQNKAKEGLDIVAHSLGAAELRRAIKKVTEKDATFFDQKENTENLNIILISPSGFNKGIIGAFKYLERTIRFNRAEGSWPLLSKSDTLHRGIDALTAFPPDGIPSEALEQALREGMPELSQYREGVERIPLEEEHENKSFLSKEQQENVSIYSAKMRLAIESGNYKGLRHLISSYGKILMPEVNKIYEGEFESAKAQGLKATKATMGAYIGAIRTLINSFGSTPMKEIANLQKKGVSVYLGFPENDIFMKLDQAIAFFEGTVMRLSS